MSGKKVTDADSAFTPGPVRFMDKYSESLRPDGITVHCPVAVALEPNVGTEQAGSSKLETA